MTAASPHRTPGRSTLVRLGWLPVLGMALAACTNQGTTPAHGWSEAGSPKQLEVERAHYRHAVYFETDSARLDAVEQDRLLRFLASVGPTAQDSVRVQGHADERASDLYNLELSGRRAASVHDFLRHRGLNGVEVRAAAYGENAPAQTGSSPATWQQNRRVEVVIDRHVVVLPPCPDWSVESGRDFANLPHSNFGCAVNANLGLMIADPRDLERGRALGPADGVHAAESIVRYRSGKVTELKEEKVD